MGVVSGAGHVIELADGTHHGARVLLLHRLPSRGHQRLDGPRQQLLPVDAALIDVVFDLGPSLLQQPVALRSGDPPRLSHKSETSGVGLPGQDHSLEVFNSLRDQLSQAIINNEVKLIDVRNQDEWEAGHLPNAHHIMLGTLPNRLDEIGKNGRSIVVQCRSGVRSAIAASILQANGIENVTNLAGGYLGWAKARLPIQKDG